MTFQEGTTLPTFDINSCSLIQMEWSYFWSQWFTGNSPWTVMLCRLLNILSVLFYTFTCISACTTGAVLWFAHKLHAVFAGVFYPFWIVLFWLAITTNTIQHTLVFVYPSSRVIHHQHRQQECRCELLIELASSPVCSETPPRVSSPVCMKTTIITRAPLHAPGPKHFSIIATEKCCMWSLFTDLKTSLNPTSKGSILCDTH